MKPSPADWPRLTSALFYQDAAAAIDWLCGAFGFEVRIKVLGDDGRVKHSELVYGEGVIMVANEDPQSPNPALSPLRSPRSLGGAATQGLMVYVDNADDHCARARARGARILAEPQTHDYGAEYWSDRSYSALDPEGHVWWIAQRVRNPPRGNDT